MLNERGAVTVLGLDPGSRVTGWGVVQEKSGQAKLVAQGTIRTPTQKSLSSRLGVIFEKMTELIKQYKPQEVAIENVFVGKHPQSALKLGQARGAALAACAIAGLCVAEYEPAKVKNALVGTGRAPKEQVAFMVAQILGVKNPDWAEDASDALAVAVSHLNHRRMNRLTQGAGA